MNAPVESTQLTVAHDTYLAIRDAITAAYAALLAARRDQLGRPLLGDDWTGAMRTFERLYDRLERLPIRQLRLMATGWASVDAEVAVAGVDAGPVISALLAGAEALEYRGGVAGNTDRRIQVEAVKAFAADLSTRAAARVS